MTDEELKVVFGGLLHDIGKVIYRQGDDRRKHSQSGYDFLKEEAKIKDNDVLESVRYHHWDSLKNAKISKGSLAYITYIADNIASAADRRKNDSEDVGFEISMPLQSVFNILNGNQQNLYYEPKTLDADDHINFPTDKKRAFDEAFYTKVKNNILNNLLGLKLEQEYINSLLEVIEGNLSYVPSSTAKSEMADISLYDHMKLTAAVGSCIYQYLQEKAITDYKTVLFTNAKAFYEVPAFLLYSMDVSGIQNFIYTITSKNALKTLRARSFYLEIMMEHIIDDLLMELHLSRANLIYSGGGHCYILLANTVRTKEVLNIYNQKLNGWLKDNFQTALYVADGYVECSANTLKNVPQGSYSDLFKKLGNSISGKKSNRYSAEDVLRFNRVQLDDYTRECKVCKRIGNVNSEGICPICSAIEGFSKNILDDEFFSVSVKQTKNSLPLPGNYYLSADSKDSLKEKMKNDNYFVRAYCKNNMFTGKHIATKLWVGNYTSGKDFNHMAKEAEGIDRIAVLRMDVDDLGQAFVAGFENESNQNRYVTLSRTATLSRQLSLFFKQHINKILGQADYNINAAEIRKRNATICYSGGDDLFIVGAWNDVIELAVDIRRNFKKYTQGTLTLSAGIGIYSSGYPISSIAREVAGMEDASKKLPGKNGITLLEDGEKHKVKKGEYFIEVGDGTYSWDEFENRVLQEKYQVICRFFETSEDRGMNFMYNLLELIRNRNEKINFARYVYILARLEPDHRSGEEQKANYREFSKQMYQWIKNEDDCRQLKTAMTLYAYMNRGGMDA